MQKVMILAETFLKILRNIPPERIGKTMIIAEKSFNFYTSCQPLLM